SIPTSESSLAHNPYVLGDSLVVLSYYGDGIQVWNIQDRTKPWRLGYYDPTGAETYSRGIWGGYPWLPSGNILGSDMDNGLYVVKVDNFQIALPVEYANWEAISDGKNAVLNWSTASETDNAGWVVEHAREDGAFGALAFVPAGVGAYEYTHLNPEEGQHFYRLRQQDYDGSESISDIKTLTFGATTKASLSAYPNPAPLGMAVTLLGVDTDDTWELHSSLGQVISTGLGNQLLTAEYPAGTYFLRIVDKGTLRIALVD
ncbi:MAG: T9SS type A sorting domain-containing protein, partial [Bacteroidota bacterium]